MLKIHFCILASPTPSNFSMNFTDEYGVCTEC